MMTDLEVFRATVEHRRPERALYHAGFTPDLRKRVIAHIGTEDVSGHYGMIDLSWNRPWRPRDLARLDFSRYWEGQTLPEGTTINDMGVARVPSGFYHFSGFLSPLRDAVSLKEIEEYPLENMSAWDYSYLTEKVKTAHAEGKVVFCFAGHMYESAWQIRGYEQFLMDMIDRPAWAECLLERIYQNNLFVAKAAAKAGVDILGTGDDVANQNAMMFSPDMWSELIHKRWKSVWQEAKAINPGIKTWYHSDGNLIDIVPQMVEDGLDILNPLQPECLDIDAIHRRFGSRLTFDGCIGTQTTMPFGTPQQVKARVKEVIEKYGSEGGLIIAPTHVLEPEVPIANIEAMVEACREYGADTC